MCYKTLKFRFLSQEQLHTVKLDKGIYFHKHAQKNEIPYKL